jgi:hypothetical protein
MEPPADSIVIDYEELNHALDGAKGDKDLFELIVNAPFAYKVQTTFLFLGITVLLLVNKETGTIDRIALSNTDLAKLTTDVSPVQFNEIKIDINDEENIIAKVIREGKKSDTTDWNLLFTPILKPHEARLNQANAGIAYSAVYPLKARDGGAIIYSYYQYRENIGELQLDFMEKYTGFVTEHLRKP